MFTTGFKFFFGLAIALTIGAVAYGYSTGGEHVGPITLGWKGGVGDHVGYRVLIGGERTYRFVRQGTELWDALHDGRLTTALLKAALGFCEEGTCAAVGMNAEECYKVLRGNAIEAYGLQRFGIIE